MDRRNDVKLNWMSYGLAVLILLVMTAFQTSAQEKDQPPFTSLFDTGASASEPLTSKALGQKTGWIPIPEDETKHRFKGDTVFLNNRLAIVLRKKGSGAELHSLSPDGYTLRAVLSPGANDESLQRVSVKILENNPNTVSLEATLQTLGGKRLALSYELNMGQVFIKTIPGDGVETLNVSSVGRFAVLPDFFADDITIDARRLPVDRTDLPGENFMLQMLGDGDALLMTVCEKRGQDVRITLAGNGDERSVVSSELHYGGEGDIWVAVLDEPGIWHHRDITQDDAGKVFPLDWDIPFPAQWRVDWTLPNHLTDSWEMLFQLEDGTFYKEDWFNNPASFGQTDWLRTRTRERWTTVLGEFLYPCWIDNQGQGYLEPLYKKKIQFEGPALFYPINRVKKTPLDRFTLVDLLRETLGTGPCEYILDLEGQSSSFKGIATCTSRDIINPIYEQKLQKKKRIVIEKALTDVFAFVKHIRERIDDYVEFGHEMKAYLQEQKKKNPGLTDFFTSMEALAQGIDTRMEKRRGKIQSITYAKGLVDEFRETLIDYEGEDALEKCKKITSALVQIGGSQDELVGECRVAVKLLRRPANGDESTRRPVRQGNPKPDTSDLTESHLLRSRQTLKE